MRLALAALALVVASCPAGAAESVPSGLTIKLGVIRNSEIGVNVNFSITNADSEPVGIVFATCTALDSDGQPKARVCQRALES